MNESPSPPPTVVSTVPQKSKTSLIYLIIIFLLILYAIPTTFFVIKSFLTDPAANQPSPVTETEMESPKQNSFFESQTATVNGKITKVSGQKITIVNNQNKTGEFEFSKDIRIMDMTNPAATPSGDLKRIQLGKNALIVLSVVEDIYQVTTITFQPNTFLTPSTIQSPSQSQSVKTTTPTSTNTGSRATPPPQPKITAPQAPKPATPIVPITP